MRIVADSDFIRIEETIQKTVIMELRKVKVITAIVKKRLKSQRTSGINELLAEVIKPKRRVLRRGRGEMWLMRRS